MRLVACALLLGGSTLTCRLGAQEVDDATRSWSRRVAMEGIAALERGDAEEASRQLEKAYRAVRLPTLGLWSARALVKRGLLVEASERYLETTRLPTGQGKVAVQEQAQKDAARELEELTPRIPLLRIDLEAPPDSEVRLTADGAPLPSVVLGEERPINPGAHRIAAELGVERRVQSVTLGEGEKKRVVLRFDAKDEEAAPVAKDSPGASPGSVESGGQKRSSKGRTLAYVALGAGGVGILAGAVTGVVAVGQKKSLDESEGCRDGQCLPSEQGDVDAFRTMRVVSTTSFIAGGVLAATGVVLWLGTGSKDRPARETGALRLSLTPQAMALSGRF